MPRSAKPPSLASIARAVGVSTTAVSLVLGGRHREHGVSVATAERIRHAAATQGYQRPTRRRGPPRLHVVHFEDLVRMEERGLGASVLHPLMDALALHGWSASIDTRFPANPAIPGADLLSAAAVVIPVNRGFDAAATTLIAAAASGGVQPVVLGRLLPAVTAIQIDGDQHAGGRLAAEHLLALGHRQCAIVSGNEDDPHSAARSAGFTEVFAKRRLRVEQWGSGGFTIAGGQRVVAGRIAQGTKPTAIFCCNDRMALGALLALRAAKLKVPTDVSLIGFDDQSEFVDVAPGLTTIRLVADGVGRRLATLLATARQPMAQHIILPAQLVVRGSTSATSAHRA